MSMAQKLGIYLLTGIMGFCLVELEKRLSIPGGHSIVSTAQARVGRPLTPVSIAGATRRTVRRCAAGVYNC
jgi:hypothetical protein